MLDTDMGLRNLDVVMGMEDQIQYNLIDLLENKCRLKQALIRDKRYPNLFMIPAGTPIIAGEEGICKGCGVATLSISYYDIGKKAGEMAYDILVNGADITTMKIETAPNVTKEYNKDICDQLGVKIPDDYKAIEAE